MIVLVVRMRALLSAAQKPTDAAHGDAVETFFSSPSMHDSRREAVDTAKVIVAAFRSSPGGGIRVPGSGA